MPYLNRRSCRLTVHSTGGLSTEDTCPRCDAPLAAEPRSLFQLSWDGSADGRHPTLPTALFATELLQDGTAASADHTARSA